MKSFTMFDGMKEHTFELPEDQLIKYTVDREAAPIDDIEAVFRKKLDHPIQQAPLSERLQPGMQVVLICDDYTRPTPAHLLLPIMLGRLNELGIPDQDITILVAAGHHREMTDEEKQKKYGPEACGRIKIVHHFSEKLSELASIGKTDTGIEVMINKLAVDADFTIGLGLVEIHPWAGFAGGGKIVNPGIAAKLTINQTHSLPIHPGVGVGKCAGNPFWETSAQSGELLPMSLLANCILDLDERIIELGVGKPRETQLWLINEFRSVNELKFERRADIVITNSYPKFNAWGQAAISLYNAARIVKPGGVRISFAPNNEGLGDCEHERDFYFRALSEKHANPRAFWDAWLGEDGCHSRNTCAVYQALCDAEHSEGIMVTETMQADLHNQPVCRTIEEALEHAFTKCGPDAGIAVYDKGGMMLASVPGE